MFIIRISRLINFWTTKKDKSIYLVWKILPNILNDLVSFWLLSHVEACCNVINVDTCNRFAPDKDNRGCECTAIKSNRVHETLCVRGGWGGGPPFMFH